MKVTLVLDGRSNAGGSPLICHNERLNDPLDPYVQAIAEKSKKRNKVLADHEDISHLEFLAGGYFDPPLDWPLNGTAKARPGVPGWNILRCLQDGGKRHKRGQDVLKGIHPLADWVSLEYEGPTAPEELWQDGSFTLRKSVGVQRNRVMRTRPMFTDWQAQIDVEVDMQVFDLHTLRVIWKDAGIYSGLGEMRPIYGRFAGTVAESGQKSERKGRGK